MKKYTIIFDSPEEMLHNAQQVIQFGQHLISLRDSKEDNQVCEYNFRWDLLKNEHE